MSNINTENETKLISAQDTENTTSSEDSNITQPSSKAVASLSVSNNLTLTPQNIGTLTRLMPRDAINLIFPNADLSEGEEKKVKGDLYFYIKVPTVNSDGSLGKLQTVTKVVTKDVERFLLTTIQDSSINIEDRKFLIGLLTTAFDQFLINIIRKRFSGKSSKVHPDDIKQQLRKGLIDSIKNFDINNEANVRLSTFAYSYFIKEYNNLANQISPVKNHTSKVALAIRSKLLHLTNEQNDITEKDITRIAEELNTSKQNVRNVINSLNARSLNQTIGDEEASELGDTLSDNHNLEEEVVQQDIFNNLRRLTIDFCENKLDDKEKFIFLSRIVNDYIFENDIPEFENYKKFLSGISKNNSLTLEEVGNVLQISAERVRQIQKDIFERYTDYVKDSLGDEPEF